VEADRKTRVVRVMTNEIKLKNEKARL